LTELNLKNSGMKLIGWNTEKELNGTTYILNTELTYTFTENIELYAVWTSLINLELNSSEKVYKCKITVRNLANELRNSINVLIFNEKFGTDYPFSYYPYDDLVEYVSTINIAYNETKTFEIEVPQSKVLGIATNAPFGIAFTNVNIDGIYSTDVNTGAGIMLLFYDIQSNLTISMDRAGIQ
jgi:hypothetical protein